MIKAKQIAIYMDESEMEQMARVHLYQYKGVLREKQDKCRAAMPLDKVGIWLDFNEFCAVDEENEAPIYLFSQADIANDSDGNDVELYNGMSVSVFDGDLDTSNMPDAILADGIVIRNVPEQYPTVKWLIRLEKHKVRYENRNEYVYRMSNLKKT